jgi:nitroreductase/SAM-dependent methyltransferase
MAQQRMHVQAPVERLFAERWSPRAFDPDRPVDASSLASCLEAARWAPSCFGEQPWRFIVADRYTDEVEWRRVLAGLTPKNQQWAGQAPVLIVAACEPLFSQTEQANRWAAYDTGQAAICLCLQAQALGLSTHQMGGFDQQALKSALAIPERLTLMSVIALGHPGDVQSLHADFQAKEASPRNRTPLEDLAHAGGWGTPWKPPANAGWEARYQETPVEDLPWFHIGLDPDIEQALEHLRLAGKAVLDLGCGPGTQAVALARLGFSVTAIDVSWSAVQSAGRLAEAEGAVVEFHVDDVLHSKLAGPFGLIVDRGVFHCFAQPDDQQAYLATIRRLLSAGGVLLLKCFHKDERREEGPPGRYTEADIGRFFANGFQLLEARESRFYSVRGEDAPKALFCVLQRL